MHDRELTHIFEKATQMRPGDVAVKHPIKASNEPHATTLIDITIIPPYKTRPTTTNYEEIANAMKSHRQTHEHNKFKINDHAKSNSTSEQLSLELIQKRYRMLLFTIDHQGMMGPIATEFLLGHKNAIFQSSPNKYDKRNTTNKTINRTLNAQKTTHEYTHQGQFFMEKSIWIPMVHEYPPRSNTSTMGQTSTWKYFFNSKLQNI